jgi:hypothetical protein
MRVAPAGEHFVRLPLLAQSGHPNALGRCPLLGVKRTFARRCEVSAYPGVSVASWTVSYVARNLASASGSGFPPLAIKSRNSSKYFSCPGGAVIRSIRPGADPEFPNACAGREERIRTFLARHEWSAHRSADRALPREHKKSPRSWCDSARRYWILVRQ